MNINNKIVGVSFFTIIFLFSITSILNTDKEYTELENRNLEQLPVISTKGLLSGVNFIQFNNYTSDQFIFRDEIVEISSSISNFLINDKFKNNIFIADDGNLYETVPSNIQNTQDIKYRIEDFGEYLKKNGINLYFAPVPNKATYFESEIPDYIPNSRYGRKFYSEILDLDNQSVVPIDLISAIDNVSENQKYFYSDHHWSIFSAFESYKEIIRIMSIDSPEYKNDEVKDNYNFTSYKEYPFYGSFSRRLSNNGYDSKDYIVLASSKSSKENQFEIYINGQIKSDFNNLNKIYAEPKYTNRYTAYAHDFSEVAVRNNQPTNKINLLLIKDSYGTPTIQFFAHHVKNLYVIDNREFKGSLSEYIEKNNIDDVVILQNTFGLASKPANTIFNID